MVDDELPPNEGDEPGMTPGPRRSTYTPPPGGIRWEPSSPEEPTASISAAESAAAGPLPGAVPPPPARRSLTDAELLAAADPTAADTDSGALLDLVERQLELRRAEAIELEEWERTVRETAPEDASAIVAAVREQFRDVVPIAPTAPAEPVVGTAAPAPPAPEAPGPTIADRLASAPPPTDGLARPSIDLALADAPPPWGQVPSAVVPPPSAAEPTMSPWSAPSPASADAADGLDAVADDAPGDAPIGPPPLVEPAPPAVGGASPAMPPESSLGLFDALLREPASEEDDGAVEAAAAAPDQPFTATEDTPAADDTAGRIDAVIPEHGTVVGAAGLRTGQLETPAPEPAPAPAPVGPRAHRLEVTALEPTLAEQRAGRAIRMFWLWFAVNASVVSVALGGVVLGLGLSLRQAILAALIGVALSFLPLGLGTLASRWSGQPTMVVSRATFGTVGNGIPALIALVTRLAWAGALLWMLSAGAAEVLVGAGLVTSVDRPVVALIAGGAGLLLAATVAGFGFGMIAVVGAVVSAISAVLVVGLIVLTAPYVDLTVALSLPDGDWVVMVAGAVLVFSAVGLAWAMSSGDVARYQARGTSGSATLLSAAFGATLPAFALIAWGAVLAASSPVIAEGLRDNPIDLIARLLPLWYPVPLIAAVALSLLSAAALALYSGGFSLLAIGVRAPRWAGVLVLVVLTGGLLALLLLLVPDTASLLRDALTTVAVPVAAWAGIFGAETMIRTRRVHSPSLLRRGGVYPAVRWVNVVMLMVIIGAGWSLTTATVPGLTWQGYGFMLLGVPLDATLAQADLGVLLALALGLLTPLVAGIPALRRLQTAERAAADADEETMPPSGPVTVGTAAPVDAPSLS